MSDSDDEKLNKARDYLLEERERRFNDLLPPLHQIMDIHLKDGGDVPAAICSLIYIANKLHRENPVFTDDEFHQCIEEIKSGGEGLSIHTPFSVD